MRSPSSRKMESSYMRRRICSSRSRSRVRTRRYSTRAITKTIRLKTAARTIGCAKLEYIELLFLFRYLGQFGKSHRGKQQSQKQYDIMRDLRIQRPDGLDKTPGPEHAVKRFESKKYHAQTDPFQS